MYEDLLNKLEAEYAHARESLIGDAAKAIRDLAAKNEKLHALVPVGASGDKCKAYIKKLEDEVRDLENVLGVEHFVASREEMLEYFVKECVYGSAGCTCRPEWPYCDNCKALAKHKYQESGVEALQKEVARLTNRLARVESACDVLKESHAEEYHMLAAREMEAQSRYEVWHRRAWEAQSKARKYRGAWTALHCQVSGIPCRCPQCYKLPVPQPDPRGGEDPMWDEEDE